MGTEVGGSELCVQINSCCVFLLSFSSSLFVFLCLYSFLYVDDYFPPHI